MQKEKDVGCVGLTDTAIKYGKSPPQKEIKNKLNPMAIWTDELSPTESEGNLSPMAIWDDESTPTKNESDLLPMAVWDDESIQSKEETSKLPMILRPMIELVKVEEASNKSPIVLPDISEKDVSDASKNEIYLSNLLIKTLDGTVIYIAEHKSFYQWNDKIWQKVVDKEIEKKIVEFVETIPKLANMFNLPKLVKKFLTAGDYGVIRDLKEILAAKLIKHEEDLNSAKNILCTRNVVIDLTTGNLFPHKSFKFSYITKMIDVNYYQDLHCTEWDEFTSSIMCDNENDALFLQKLFGYALLGNPKEQKSYLLYGEGSNGKSTLIRAIQGVMSSEFVCKLPIRILTGNDSRDAEAPAPAVARLKDKLMVFASEISESDFLNESKFKSLVGSGMISARGLRENGGDFQEKFDLFIDTNNLPKLRESDFAIFRRLVVIPFKRIFKGKDVKQNLSELFASDSCKECILSWLVKGALLYQDDEKVELTDNIRIETDKYILGQNSIGRFFEECIVEAEDNIETSEVVYAAYSSFCEKNDLHPKTKNTFFKNSKFNKIEKIRTSSYRGYKGIKLIDGNIKEGNNG